MRFDLDFYERIIRPEDSNRLKFKFEKFLQVDDLLFTTKMDKKLITIEEIIAVFESNSLIVNGTHVRIGDDIVPSGKNSYFCTCTKCGLVQRLSFQYAKRGVFVCYGCLVERHYDEAKSHNLELIGRSVVGDSKRRYYRFSCGHTRDIATGDVRFGQFSCTECKSNALQGYLDYYGFELLGRPPKSICSDPTQFYHVMYKGCGHVRIVTQQNLFARSIGGCSECYEGSLQSKVGEKFGVDILCVVPGAKRNIRFRDCGHEKIVGLSNLKSGNMECSYCKVENWEREASSVGLLYLGPNDEEQFGRNRKHKYKPICGHTISLKPSSVRVGHWACRVCDSGYLDRPNYLYLFDVICPDGNSFLKLGFSGKPEYRKNDYQAVPGTRFTLLKKVFVPTGREVIIIENTLHLKYKSFNLPREFVINYLTESGFTECYPNSLREHILKDLEDVELGLIKGAVSE